VVLTIEPALYIPDDEAYGPLRGIGVRIEDDIAITATGHENLSADVPVEVEQVEQLVGSAL
jgi:Xaa-Pro aminopeptidase